MMERATTLAFPAACPDCPGARLGTMQALVGATKAACAFECVAVSAGQPIPHSDGQDFVFGHVRRGIVLRQRGGRAGHGTPVDAVGAGGFLPIAADRDSRSEGLDVAATDALVCLCRRAQFDAVLDRSPDTAREVLSLQFDALQRVEAIAAARGAPTAESKVSALLVALTDRLSLVRRPARLPADLRHRDLAALIGVRHETFSRVLRHLERRGAVRHDQDGLRIIDRTKLAPRPTAR